MRQWIVKRLEAMSASELYAVMQARADVFVREQKILYPDADGEDLRCLHLYTLNEVGKVLAYLRMFQADAVGNVRFGRVLTTLRGQGLGRVLIQKAAQVARDQFTAEMIVLHAQQSAEGFYRRLGFSRTSSLFIEAGIPHVAMQCPLTDLVKN